MHQWNGFVNTRNYLHNIFFVCVYLNVSCELFNMMIHAGPSVALADGDAVEGEEEDDDMEVADEDEPESEETVSFTDQGAGGTQQQEEEEEDVSV